MRRLAVHLLLFITIGIGPSASLSQALTGPYLGQEPPTLGDAAEPFAANFISSDPNQFQAGGAFTPDGNEFYYTTTTRWWDSDKLMVVKQVNGVWATPAQVAFPTTLPSRLRHMWHLVLSPDGQKMIFASDKNNTTWVYDLFLCERNGTGWTDPIRMGISSLDATCLPGSITNDGTLYFFGRDVGAVKSTPVDGQYTTVEPLPDIFLGQETPFVSADGSFAILNHLGDLYISYHDRVADTWSEERALGPEVNTDIAESFAFFSPDRKYLFFNRDTGPADPANRIVDLHWIDARTVGIAWPVPEPASALMLRLAGTGLFAWRRRTRYGSG